MELSTEISQFKEFEIVSAGQQGIKRMEGEFHVCGGRYRANTEPSKLVYCDHCGMPSKKEMLEDWQEIEGFRNIREVKSKQVVRVVKNRYQLTQHQDIHNVIEELAGDHAITVKQGGVHGNLVVWSVELDASIKTNPDDVIIPYLWIVHNIAKPSGLILCPASMRMSCTNQMGHIRHALTVSLRHDRDFDKKAITEGWMKIRELSLGNIEMYEVWREMTPVPYHAVVEVLKEIGGFSFALNNHHLQRSLSQQFNWNGKDGITPFMWWNALTQVVGSDELTKRGTPLERAVSAMNKIDIIMDKIEKLSIDIDIDALEVVE